MIVTGILPALVPSASILHAEPGSEPQQNNLRVMLLTHFWSDHIIMIQTHLQESTPKPVARGLSSSPHSS
jgi:hypothetical protein